jgi:hypothetical protein
MSSDESEHVLTLLKTLSILKDLDSEYESGSKTESEQDAHSARQQRHHDIVEEIKAVAERKKNGKEQSPIF